MRSMNASEKRALIARFRQTARSLIAVSARFVSRSSSSSDAPLSAALPRIAVRSASGGRDQADGDRAPKRQVPAEAARDIERFDLPERNARLLRKRLHARSNRRLG